MHPGVGAKLLSRNNRRRHPCGSRKDASNASRGNDRTPHGARRREHDRRQPHDPRRRKQRDHHPAGRGPGGDADVYGVCEGRGAAYLDPDGDLRGFSGGFGHQVITK